MANDDSNFSLSWIVEYFPPLSYAIRGGVGDWFDLVQQSPQVAVAQTSRSRPNMICDLIGQRAREAFADVPNQVRVDTLYETTQLTFLEHDVVLKFNQLDESLKIHPSATQRAQSFVYQQHLLPYPGIYASTDGLSLIGGYRLDVNHTALLHATVTCQHDEEVVWHQHIPEPPADNKFSLVKPVSPKAGPSVRDLNDERRIEGM